MKKYMKSLLLLALTALVFTGCKEEYGTDPGHDGTPVATVYKYTAGKGYNPDNDCLFRIATNAAVGEVYYLSELKSAKEERKMTEAQYSDYVVANGMVGYTRDITDHNRAGSTPLVVKAIGVKGASPIVSNEDATKILAENEKSGFLSDTRVVFVR